MTTKDEVLLELEEVEVAGVAGPPLRSRLRAGECGILRVANAREAAALAEVILGVGAPRAGVVRLCGAELYALLEEERRGVLAETGFVGGAHGGLIGNLKVWENLLLPGAFHQRLVAEEAVLEEEMTALLEVAGEGPEWEARWLPGLPDALSEREARLAGLIRAWLGASRLVVAESLFVGLGRHASAGLVAALGWMMRRRPGLGVLCLHHGPMGPAHLDLQPLPNVWIMNVKEENDEILQEQ